MAAAADCVLGTDKEEDVCFPRNSPISFHLFRPVARRVKAAAAAAAQGLAVAAAAAVTCPSSMNPEYDYLFQVTLIGRLWGLESLCLL